MLFRNFYPGDCKRQIAEFLGTYRPRADVGARALAAVVPHAGWAYSGGVAARTLKALAEGPKPEVLLLLGAVHRERIHVSAAYPAGEWDTPLGPVTVAGELAAEVHRELAGLVEMNAGAHDSEHSLEVLLPFVHEIFPEVPVLPLMIPPEASPEEIGERLGSLLANRGAVAVASTDLTHYGARFNFTPAGKGEAAHAWMQENDRRMLDRSTRLEAGDIPREALIHRNACGSGALAAATAFARAGGARKGTVLEHTDSYAVTGEKGPFETAVGYAGVLL
jgi:hypothetical protein